MQPLTATELHGNWATILLSWRDDDSLDVDLLEQQIDILISLKVDGIYSHGTAGEFHCQTELEFDAISKLLADRCNAARMPFQIGVSHMSSQVSLERLKRVVELSPSAVQLILPDWLPTTESENITFLERMAAAANGIGLVLYNPPHAKRVMDPKSVARLSAAVPELIGVKTAGGDDEWYAAMRKHLSGLSVFVPGHRLASGVQRGASGAYSNVACLNPQAAQRWFELLASDLEAALELERRLRCFMDLHISSFITEQEFCNAACDRLLAIIGDWTPIGHKMRWPYRSIPLAEAERLRPIAEELLPEFFGQTSQS